MEITLSVTALIISVITGAFAIYTFFWTARRDRRQATLDAYFKLQASTFDHLNEISREEIQEIAKDPKSKKYKEVSGYIARIEHFCVGVNEGIYDRKTVYRLAHGYIDQTTIRGRIEPILEQKRRISNKEYYENILAVWDWMDRESRRIEKREASRTDDASS